MTSETLLPVTRWDSLFGLLLLSQCGSTYNCSSRSVTKIHSACCKAVKEPQANNVTFYGCTVTSEALLPMSLPWPSVKAFALRVAGQGLGPAFAVDRFPGSVIPYFTLLYFFLPLVLVGVAGRHSCLSAARRVAWRRDIPWVLRVSATESLHRFLGLPLALQPEYLVLYARRAGWFMGIHVMCPNHLICCCLMCCRTGFAPTMSRITIFDFVPPGLVYCFSQAFQSYQWLKNGTPVTSLPSTWCCRVGTGTGWPSYSSLWLDETEKFELQVLSQCGST